MPLAHWLHDWDPFLIEFPDTMPSWLPLDGIRWYGLAYLLAFFFAYWLLRRFSRAGMLRIPPAAVADFITLAAIFGVMLGGRLGYLFLYDKVWLADPLADPARIFQVWKGGMASHGGIAGLIIFTYIFARLRKTSWTNLGDHLVIAAPLGIFFGRLANFINGELFGRPSQVPWAVKFPDELTHSDSWARHGPADTEVPANQVAQLVDAARYYGGGHPFYSWAAEQPERLEALSRILNPRHPSQIYQALLEGLALFLVLLLVRLRWRMLPDGLLTALFFIGYASFRIVGELWREPDSGHAPLWDLMSKGQFYSLFLYAIGAAFLMLALRNHKRSTTT